MKKYDDDTDTVEPLLLEPLLSELSIIQPLTHSPNSILTCYFRLSIVCRCYYLS